MKQKSIRHGEVFLLPIAQLPKDAVEFETVKQCVVAHSESGHHHVAVGDITIYKDFDVAAIRQQLTKQLYEGAEITGLLKVNQDSELRHQKNFDAHETKPLTKGLYLILHKTNYDYFSKRTKKVED